MLSVRAHRDRILAATRPLPAVLVALGEAKGLVLARDVHAATPVPAFDNSAMDGYAVRAADAASSARLSVVGDVPAGSSLNPPILANQAVRIMTGAPVPSDADAIVPLEATDLGTGIGPVPPSSVVVTHQPTVGAHIRRRGDDLPLGERVVSAGTALSSWQLSAIAATGHAQVWVHRRPTAAVIVTGSELMSPAAKLAAGQIPESNSYLLCGGLQDAGAEVVRVTVIADDADELATALNAAVNSAQTDVVVLSGGVSVGAFDVVRTTLAATAEVQFDSVAMHPGRPQGFGVTASGTLLLCLPGNPVAAAVSMEMFVRPAVRALAGHSELDRVHYQCTAAEGWASPSGRTQVMPGIVDGDRFALTAPGGRGAHRVRSLATANALAVVPPEVTQVSVGDVVSVALL